MSYSIIATVTTVLILPTVTSYYCLNITNNELQYHSNSYYHLNITNNELQYHSNSYYYLNITNNELQYHSNKQLLIS